MVVERQRVSYQPPKSVSLVRFLRDEPAENARSEEDGTAIDDCTAARPGRRARPRLSILLGDFGWTSADFFFTAKSLCGPREEVAAVLV